MRKENVVSNKGLSSRQFVGRDLPHPLLLGQEEKQPCFTRDVEDPRQRPSGMTTGLMGFTLIELLVVVLIIGILAAVSVPQYQLAVLKSKFATMYSNLQTLATAAEVYYLANSAYPHALSELDISEFTGCNSCGENSMVCNNIFLQFSGGHSLMANGMEYGNSQVYGYILSGNVGCSWSDKNMVLAYYQPLQHASTAYTTKMCKGWNAPGRKLCISLGGTENGSGTYILPD